MVADLYRKLLPLLPKEARAALKRYEEFRRLVDHGQPIPDKLLVTIGEAAPYGYTYNQCSCYWEKGSNFHALR